MSLQDFFQDDQGFLLPDLIDLKELYQLHKVDFKNGKGLLDFNEWEDSVELTEQAKDYPYIIL